MWLARLPGGNCRAAPSPTCIVFNAIWTRRFHRCRNGCRVTDLDCPTMPTSAGTMTTPLPPMRMPIFRLCRRGCRVTVLGCPTMWMLLTLITRPPTRPWQIAPGVWGWTAMTTVAPPLEGQQGWAEAVRTAGCYPCSQICLQGTPPLAEEEEDSLRPMDRPPGSPRQ